MHCRFALFVPLLTALWLSAIGGVCGAAEISIKFPDSAAYRPAATPPNLRAPVTALGKGVFLVASERLNDPNFMRSVILLLEYDPTGALGLIINRPSDVALASALPEVEALSGRPDHLYVGGPVGRNQLFLLVRAASRPEDADLVVNQVYASVSLDTLRSLLTQENAEFHAHAGYAGWGSGQLDGEVKRGDWYVIPADAVTIFDQPPEHVWPALIKKNAGLWVRRMSIRTGLRQAACNPTEAHCRRSLAQIEYAEPGTPRYVSQSSSR